MLGDLPKKELPFVKEELTFTTCDQLFFDVSSPSESDESFELFINLEEKIVSFLVGMGEVSISADLGGVSFLIGLGVFSYSGLTKQMWSFFSTSLWHFLQNIYLHSLMTWPS